MRIPGNKVKHLRDFFYSELKDSFDHSEITAMFSTAAEHVLGFTKTQLITNAEENINQSDLLKLYDCAKDLKKQIPLQYILGEAWFYNLRLKVNNHVLIPRPETEELTDMILKENQKTSSLLDLCTGSGCIAIAYKKNRPESEVTAADISIQAIEVATENANSNGCQVRFIIADVLREKDLGKIKGPFDIIVSNPPYIKQSESSQMSDNVLKHEPHLALFVEDDDAVIFYKKIIDHCKEGLSRKGKLYFELNPATAETVGSYASSSGTFSKIEILKDMSGSLRFLKATK